MVRHHHRVLVFPSETDAFGNVVLEALAAGVPAVVSDRGGPRSIIQPGVDGFVAPDDAAMAEAVLRMAGDADAHGRMREAARRRAVESSWDAVFERVYATYGRVARDHAARRHAAASTAGTEVPARP